MQALNERAEDGTGRGDVLRAALRRALRRYRFLTVVNELALASAAVFAAVAILLITGTEVLTWYWLAGLSVLAAGICGWRLRRRSLSPYRMARLIDQRLELHDALSTAWYFHEHPGATSSRATVEQQAAMAERAARDVNVKTALPFRFSRCMYLSGSIAAAAICIFGLRYGITRSLDLRPALVQIRFDTFLSSDQPQTNKKAANPLLAKASTPVEQMGLSFDPWHAKADDRTGTPEDELATTGASKAENKSSGAAAEDKREGNPSAQQPEQQGEASAGNRSAPGQRNAAASPSEDGQRSAQQQNGPQRASAGSGNSSLTDKMRDALSNLLAKLHMQPKEGGANSASQNGREGGREMAKNGALRDQNGSPAPGKGQQQANASPDGQGDPQQSAGSQSQNASGKSAGHDAQRDSAQQGNSGAGSQDGDKDAKEAAQLAAMGKISEILGKRSQNVSGEVMVEVAPGRQRLRTAWSSRRAQHADTGGEISRDEVPLAYQQYVQQYFEAIRKQPPLAAPQSRAKSEPPRAGATF